MIINRKKSAGIGLLELMLSLAIIAIIMLLATRYFRQTEEEMKVTKAASMVSNLIDASWKWNEGKPNFDGISIDDLINLKLVPDDYKYSPWTQKGLQDVFIESAQKDGFYVMIMNISKQACFNLKDIIAKENSSFEQDCQLVMTNYEYKLTVTSS